MSEMKKVDYVINTTEIKEEELNARMAKTIDSLKDLIKNYESCDCSNDTKISWLSSMEQMLSFELTQINKLDSEIKVYNELIKLFN